MNASLTCCGIYICNRLQQRCPWGVYIWIFYLSPRRALWRQETCAWNIEVHVREGGIDCSPVVKFVSVVVGRHNVQQEDVFRFQVQAWHPELHLGKHLSGIGNIYLVKKYFWGVKSRLQVKYAYQILQWHLQLKNMAGNTNCYTQLIS